MRGNYPVGTWSYYEKREEFSQQLFQWLLCAGTILSPEDTSGLRKKNKNFHFVLLTFKQMNSEVVKNTADLSNGAIFIKVTAVWPRISHILLLLFFPQKLRYNLLLSIGKFPPSPTLGMKWGDVCGNNIRNTEYCFQYWNQVHRLGENTCRAYCWQSTSIQKKRQVTNLKNGQNIWTEVSQKIYTYGKWTHEKKILTTTYQRNLDLNYNEVPHISTKWSFKRWIAYTYIYL